MSYAIKLLGEICEISTGSTDTKDATENGQYPLFDRSKKVKASEKYLFDCEALIMPGEGAEFLPRHYIGKFDLHQRAYAMFNFSNLVDPQYLYYYLISVKDYFANNAVGATVKSLRRRHFTDLEIPLPSLEKQREIVEKLDSAFAEIDLLEFRQVESLNYAKAMLESCIDKFLCKDHEQTAPLSDFATFENGDRGSNYPNKNMRVAVGIPFINAGHIGEGKLDMSNMDYISKNTFEKLNRGKIRKNDLLFCLRGSLGKVALLDDLMEGAIASSLVIVRAKEKINPQFLLYYSLSSICKSEIENYRSGTAQPNLGASDLKKFSVPKHSPISMDDIVAKVEQVAKIIENLVNNYEKRVSAVAELRHSLLNGAFTHEEAVA